MKNAPGNRVFRWPVQAAPAIRVAGRFPMGDNSRGRVYQSPTHALHQHDYRGSVWLGRRRIDLRPGDLTITPAGLVSRYDLPDNGFHLCLHFVPQHPAPAVLKLPLFWRAGAQAGFVTTRLRHIIELLRQSQQRGPTGARAAIAAGAALQAFLAWLAFAAIQPHASQASRRSRPSLDQLLAILDERFCQPLAIPDLATQVGLSRNYLTHLFHRRMGLTIQQYILHRRVELAQHLLATTRLSIKQIGAEVGLPDPQHFNKRFRRVTGASPSAARWNSPP